jgi:methylmalonyl-CoA mutase
MHIDDFAPNLSFFFSNGMDAEYSVIGRVARRIWAKAIKQNTAAASVRKTEIPYSNQRPLLHAQEIDFNDIRTTLQALYAIYDNCNSACTPMRTTKPLPRLPKKACAVPWPFN